MRQTGTLVFKTDLGWVGLAVAENGSKAGICRIVPPRASKQLVERALGVSVRPEASGRSPILLEAAGRQMKEFLAGKRREFDFPIDLSAGTPFQRRVWRVLDRIPYGRVRSYKWVAVRVGGSRYARAVGLALGANLVPIAIPCHRMVAHDGSLGGFTGGLGTKRKLLELEGTLRQLSKKR